MTNYAAYKPPANGVAPRGWQEGMAWDTQPYRAGPALPLYWNPSWNKRDEYRVPPEALHYPIVPYEGDWGAEIAVNGRPEWLPDGQVCAILDRHWLGLKKPLPEWNWNTITKIRLPASHGYYADNVASDAFNLDTWLSETKANLSAIEAAGHSVTFAPDWAEQLWFDACAAANGCGQFNTDAIALIRSRVRPVL